ncbi:ptuative ATP synthase protein I [Cyanobacterium stanieri PCC 7202]|uniref:Ptuative ATP synthase protein I n=1 Tax=Cyanobacterium stanieri (strain ATCC 29140 / PCC 7202) TaxID=292563 RepID=K9YIZ1_CYASC|nr:ptuative ATP synthase protein I [Cyanobacterium stanieri PCC 7202]
MRSPLVTTSDTSPTTENQETLTDRDNDVDSTQDNSMAEYYQLKYSILIATLVIALSCFILVWVFYSLSTGLNYLLGACVGLVYLNLLAREVEKVGSGKKRIGSTRLALFAGLMIIATQREQLQVMPIFLGFMTYKASILFYVLPSSLLSGKNKSE